MLNQEVTTIRMKRTMDEDANGVGNKKLRNDVEEAPPSRVVHIRSVPLGVVETDIALLAVPFGFMTNMLLAKKKSQALINMQSLDVASEMVDYYSRYPPIMNGKKLIVQFSTHQELVTEQENQACQRAIRAAAEQTQHLLSDTESFNHRTLRILIENCISNITLSILFKVFSRYGMIEKLLVFKKNANYQALLQYENPLEARVAKVMLNDKNIYDEGCTLRIAYSKQRELDIRTDGPSSRDFTRKPMTDREMRELDRPNPNPGILGGSGSAAAVAAAAAAMKAASGPGNMNLGPGGLSGPAPSGPGIRGMPPSPGMGLPSGIGGTGPSITGPRPGLQGGFSTAAGSITNMLGIPQQQMMAAAAAATAAGLSPVVMVSNMNEQQMTPDKLFTLFGVFGDVMRVKQLYNKRDCALVQFTDPLGANRAIEFLNGIRLYNHVLRVTRSKHMRIQMPREEVDEGYTRDYSDSRLHRFKKPGSKNLQNIFPPSEHLHLSNLPENMTEEEIQEFFERYGFPLVGIRFIAKGHKMALVRLKSVEDACEALISLHDTELDANHHLRVSFTAAVI